MEDIGAMVLCSRKSPPSRGRGSKHLAAYAPSPVRSSPPSRGRGSKRLKSKFVRRRSRVASLAGAWIETPNTSYTVNDTGLVASLAGAWIETRSALTVRPEIIVASLAGAWIETFGMLAKTPERSGRLPRGGVDRNCAVALPHDEAEPSPPSRGRGSKRF